MASDRGGVRVEYDHEGEELQLHCVQALLESPVFLALVRKLGGEILETGLARLPTKEDELSSRYQTLKALVARFGEDLVVGRNVQVELKKVEISNREFEEFSNKAREIWNVNFHSEEFENFVDAIKVRCSGRKFYRAQLLSAFHMAFSQNACNFSVPGAGKTSIVYAAYAFLKSLSETNPKKVDRLLIVGPLSSFKAWEDEYQEIFDRRPVSIRLAGGIDIDGRKNFLRGISTSAKSTELILTSYQSLYRNQEDFRNFLEKVASNCMVVLDEAHYVKGQSGEWSAAALSIAPFARARVALTGTPAPNGYEDLANLFQFLYPDRNVIGFPLSSLKAMSEERMPSAIPQLKERIQPFYTRIKKKDLNLPDVQVKVVTVPMGKAQESIYRDIEGKIVPGLKRQFSNAKMQPRIRAKLIRLRQAAANPALLLRPLKQEDGLFDTNDSYDLNISELEIAQKIEVFDPHVDLERLKSCKNLVEQILKEQKKVLIWSYFIGNLDLLRKEFEGVSDFLEVLTGATPVAGEELEDGADIGTREEIIDRFHSQEGSAILIANPQAVGESISLHKACRSAIYFDRDFNAGRFIQSKDRIHRYSPDQALPVSYYYLVASESVDEDIARRLALKERRLAELVDDGDIPILTSSFDGDEFEDIRRIIQSYEQRKVS